MKAAARRRWLRLAVAGAVAAGFAALVVISGVVPVGASSGHWAVTEAFLHFAMQRSIATHSMAAPEAPSFDDRRIRIGAGHYEGGCRFCHGAPGAAMPVVARHMTPPPPRLAGDLARYDDRELFTIVRHGVKLTGMPAWPAADREDEVWAVVAFLRVLPELDGDGYRRWVAPTDEVAEAPAVVRRACARCHGHEGLDPAFPRLAGQREAYLLGALEAYASGARPSGIMQPIAVALDEEGMREAAAWYAGRAPVPSIAGDDGRGAAIVEHGITARDVPACAHCHGPGRGPHHPAYPHLAGQPAAYLEEQLQLFVRGVRGGARHRELMEKAVAHALRPEEIVEVSRFFAGTTR